MFLIKVIWQEILLIDDVKKAAEPINIIPDI